MTRKSTGLMGVMAVAIGLVGFTVTGCGLGTANSVVAPLDTIDNNPPVENIVPIEQADVDLSRSR